jgi:hypothetical protein
MLRCLAATAPRLHVRDDRDTSLFTRRDAQKDAADLPDTPSGIFFAARLDEWNRVESTNKIRFYARRILWPNARSPALQWTTTGLTLPVGQRANGAAHAKAMTSHLQIQLIDDGNIDLMLVYAPFEPQMNSGDFRLPGGEQTLGDDIADDLGAKAPTTAQPAFKWTELKKTQESSVILKFATPHHAAPFAMSQRSRASSIKPQLSTKACINSQR